MLTSKHRKAVDTNAECARPANTRQKAMDIGRIAREEE